MSTTQREESIEWVDEPPPPAKRGPDYESWASAVRRMLMERPGKWAAVKVYNGKGGSYANELVKLGCQAVTRQEPRGQVTYARWPVES